MDALRRAETPASDTEVDATAPAQEASVPVEEDEISLALEPLNGTAPQVEMPAENTSEVNTPQEPANDTPPVTELPAEHAADKPGRVKLAQHSAWTHNALIFGSGFLFVLLTMGGYYAWKSDQLPAPGHFQSAILINEPQPASTAVAVAPGNVSAKPDTVPVQTVTTPVSNNVVNTTPQPGLTQTGSAPQTEQRPTPPIRISKKRKASGVNPQLSEAYQAYQQKDYTHAESMYRQVLRRYPDNRDALLGLAAIAMYQNRYAVAQEYYGRVLKTHPGDNVARVALQSLTGSGDSLKDGSRLKHWLQSEPDNPQLHFALGNHYADSGNWKAAQNAYFQAFNLAPERADYAFNLAIALDQLSLRTQALNYYREARKLGGSTTLFDIKQLDKRIGLLEKTGEPDS